jgi:hypothetical protein
MFNTTHLNKVPHNNNFVNKTELDIHHFAGNVTIDNAITILNNRQVSYHYLQINNTVYNLVSPERRAWHNGNATNGSRNDIAIGYCIMGNFTNRDITTNELATATNAIKTIIVENNISLNKVKPHNATRATLCPGFDITLITNEIHKELNIAKPKSLLEKWQKEAIEQSINLGISDGTRPFNTATRVEVMAMITRAIELVTKKGVEV